MTAATRREPRTRVKFVGLILVLTLIPLTHLAGASPLQLDAVSLSFPTPQHGYVLSLYDCSAKTCATLRSTSDGGSHWKAVPIPPQLEQNLRLVSWGFYGTSYTMLDVHFADASNGWIYGTVPASATTTTANPNWVSRLWSTHNGGKTWIQIRLGPLSLTGGVIQMATHQELTYLFGSSALNGRAYLLATHSNADQWKSGSNALMEMPAGGTQLEGAFTFSGTKGWFVAGNDRGFSASARLSSNGSWSVWNGPSFENLGASFTPLSAVTSRVLLAEGASAGFVYPPTSSVPNRWNNGASWLFISYDAGATFKPFRQLTNSFQGSYSTVPGLPSVPVPGTILLQRNMSSGSNLVRSTNWGRTWRVVLDHPIRQIVFTSRTIGYAIVQEESSQSVFSLFRTGDSGSHWLRVSL